MTVSSIFLLNLFVGVLFMNFTKVQSQATSSFGDILITEDQLNWIEVQKMIIRAEPNYNARTVPPQYNWRKPIHQFVTSVGFETFIAMVILANMLQMAMLYDSASEAYLLALDILNYIFTGIFTIEVCLKLISFSHDYWRDGWNIFDFLIVACSYVDIIFSSISPNSLRFLQAAPQIIRVLRVLRVSRLFRLVKKYQRLQQIMEIIQLCLPSMMNVFSLLFLIYFIYAILGCYLFNNQPYIGQFVSDWFNYSNFGFAMLLLFKNSTGEDWNNFMFEFARTDPNCAAGLGCGRLAAYAFYLSFKFIVTFVMINLFVLVVLGLFDKYFIQSDNIMSKFKEDVEIFQTHWLALGPTHSGYMLNQSKLLRFFSRLPDPLGLEGMGPNELTKFILDMSIRRYNPQSLN